MKVVQPFSLLELPDGRYHLILIVLTETVVKGQPDQPFTFLFAHGTTPIPPPMRWPMGERWSGT